MSLKIVVGSVLNVVCEVKLLFVSVLQGFKFLAIPHVCNSGQRESAATGLWFAGQAIVNHKPVLSKPEVLINKVTFNKTADGEVNNQITSAVKRGLISKFMCFDHGKVFGRGVRELSGGTDENEYRIP